MHHDYDIASRLTSLTYDGQTFASNIVYNAASQTTSLNVGTGANQIIESYGYNAQTGLLENQTVAKTATPTIHLLDLSYDYTNASGKRTGQTTKILNNLNPNKDRGYTYDALGRLVQATGGPSTAPLWTQSYSYDRYGNRTSVSASGYSAANKSAFGNSQSEIAKVSEPRAVATGSSTRPSTPSLDLLARNDRVELSTLPRDDTKPLSDSPPTLYSSAPQSGPPTFTDDPLVAGVTVIKAIHLTELRTAINQLRGRAGLAGASWVESVTSGVTIKASHITEMRSRLEEARSALGLSATTYTDPGLAAGYTVKAVHIQEIRDSLKAALNTSSQIPRDGHASLSYDTGSNRITSAGFAYDAAGNQTQVSRIDGSVEKFQYDAANRLRVVRDANNNQLASYTYGDSNERLIAEEGSSRIYYVGEGGATTTEYTEANNSEVIAWSKSYVYLSNRLLSTLTPNGSGGETIQFHHPDRLGTRLSPIRQMAVGLSKSHFHSARH